MRPAPTAPEAEVYRYERSQFLKRRLPKGRATFDNILQRDSLVASIQEFKRNISPQDAFIRMML